MAVPSTLSEENQSVVEVQIEALKAAISGLKKIGSANDTLPEDPDDTSPSPSPSPSPDTGGNPPSGGNSGSTGGNTGGSTGGSSGSTGGSSGGTGGSVSGGTSQSTIPPATSNPTKEPTATVTPPVITTPVPVLPEPSAAPSEDGDGTGDTGNDTNPVQTPVASDNGQPDNSDDDKSNSGKPGVSGYNKNRFDVTSTKDRTVVYKKPPVNSGSKVKIPATVKVTENGKKVTYKVTSIKKNAFKGNKKVKQIIVGKNIKTIGKNAFKNCSKMKKMKMKIKSKSIKKVGKAAFKGISKKCIIQVPKSKKKVYTKMFRKAGLNKKAKIVGK